MSMDNDYVKLQSVNTFIKLNTKQRSIGRNNKANIAYSFLRIKDIELDEEEKKFGFSMAWIGFDFITGVPKIMRIRPMSYGFFMDGESWYQETTYERLNKETGLNINSTNFKDFIPKEIMDDYNENLRCEPMMIEADNCVMRNQHIIDYIFVSHHRRFGASFAAVGRFGDGFHAFYIANCETGKTMIPMNTSSLPSLVNINKALEIKSDFKVFDRVLTYEEYSFFANMFFAIGDDPNNTTNDIYGATTAHYEYSVDGQCVSREINTVFSEKIENLISDIAEKGIVTVRGETEG